MTYSNSQGEQLIPGSSYTDGNCMLNSISIALGFEEQHDVLEIAQQWLAVNQDNWDKYIQESFNGRNLEYEAVNMLTRLKNYSQWSTYGHQYFLYVLKLLQLFVFPHFGIKVNFKINYSSGSSTPIEITEEEVRRLTRAGVVLTDLQALMHQTPQELHILNTGNHWVPLLTKEQLPKQSSACAVPVPRQPYSMMVPFGRGGGAAAGVGRGGPAARFGRGGAGRGGFGRGGAGRGGFGRGGRSGSTGISESEKQEAIAEHEKTIKGYEEQIRNHPNLAGQWRFLIAKKRRIIADLQK